MNRVQNVYCQTSKILFHRFQSERESCQQSIKKFHSNCRLLSCPSWHACHNCFISLVNQSSLCIRTAWMEYY